MRSNKSDINYFLALMTAGSVLGLWFVSPFINTVLLIVGGGVGSIMWSIVVTVALVLVGIFIVWMKNGALSPVSIAIGRERRYRAGSILTGMAHIFLVLAVVVIIAGHLTIRDFGVISSFLFAGALVLAALIDIVGIVCVETSRQRK